MDNYLSNKKKLLERANKEWPQFLSRRKQRLAQMELRNGGAEKITESILEDLFTIVLDWPLANVDYQSGRCDIVLTDIGIKRLLVETKYPGSFQNDTNMKKALLQVNRYSEKLNVNKVAVSDGYRLYAIDLKEGKVTERVDVFLDSNFPEDLWLLSVHGIYRPTPQDSEERPINFLSSDELLHPKYQLPADCFAYAGNPNDPKSWSLPYLLRDRTVDKKRLPKAISAIISNYRGTKVKKIPETAIPMVLKTLEKAARQIRKMPDQFPKTSQIYKNLANILKQF